MSIPPTSPTGNNVPQNEFSKSPLVTLPLWSDSWSPLCGRAGSFQQPGGGAGQGRGKGCPALLVLVSGCAGLSLPFLLP